MAKKLKKKKKIKKKKKLSSHIKDTVLARMVKNLPAMWETQVWSLGQEDPLKKGMATHPSILAWRIPWMEKTGGLLPMGLQRVGHDWMTVTSLHFQSAQSFSRIQLFVIPLTVAHGFPVHQQLSEITQTHGHQVSDTIQPSHPLSSPSPPAFNHSQHQGLFQWVSSSHQVAKELEF